MSNNMSNVAADESVAPIEFDPSLSQDERRFYTKAYPYVELVKERTIHCTVCKTHLGSAPCQEVVIKMHPVLRVTHCTVCHDFYNSGEFSKGEDGSELYCRWCGQGGEVYCCSNCPFVFCKSCIVKNLSRGVVADIEQNENWSCFNCAPKILWPLRAQHWALINYIEKQKREINAMNLSESEKKQYMNKDHSTCCRVGKMKSEQQADSLGSVEPNIRRCQKPNGYSPPVKRAKVSNDEVVCTPDLLSMLEPDCEITFSQKPATNDSLLGTPAVKLNVLQSRHNQISTQKNSIPPPPLVLRNTSVQILPSTPDSTVQRSVTGSQFSSSAPVYHTINGYRIDLNSAAQQDTFRLPNGKLIQVKRQSTQQQSKAAITNTGKFINFSQNSQPTPLSTKSLREPIIRADTIGTTYNNAPIRPINSLRTSVPHLGNRNSAVPRRTVMVQQQAYPDTPIGQARTKLQKQVFNSMEICDHLTVKIQTLANSTDYKQARNHLEVKELYIHLSYLLTYAIGRFKGLQDKCLAEMCDLGFVNDVNDLENGQLAAGVDYVRYGQLEDVDLLNTGCNSFHNQVYEYRKSLHGDYEDTTIISGDEMKRLDNICNTTDEESLIKPMRKTDAEVDVIRKTGTDFEASKAMKKYNNSEKKSHAYDRKLACLVEQYPSIWCTRHSDYGNFDVTRRHWRTIASHFKRGENIKLRWKNIRKRYVRIERRTREGKRFNGYFDTCTNFLCNRNLSIKDWSNTNGRKSHSEHLREKIEESDENALDNTITPPDLKLESVKPIDIHSLDLRIINFMRSHPILWRKPNMQEKEIGNEEICKSLWLNLGSLIPNITCDDIISRWQHLYEMYKTFRFKNIKNNEKLHSLELKYSKYLVKLYFLYKIDENNFQNDSSLTEYTEFDEYNLENGSLLEMADDRKFVRQLVSIVHDNPPLWDKYHDDYHDTILRKRLWNEISANLSDFQRNAKTIKLRWYLAKHCYKRWCHESSNGNVLLSKKYYKNLPTAEMSFLDKNK